MGIPYDYLKKYNNFNYSKGIKLFYIDSKRNNIFNLQ